MSDIQIFRNENFGEVRVITNEQGEPMFAATDVCNVLGYANPSKAISDHVDEDDRYNQPLERGGNMLFINESGLYSLILRSSKPSAKPFRKWVTSEVLPSIRKTGGYLIASGSDTEAEILARAVLVAQDTLKRRERRIAQLESDNKALVAINHEQAEAISEMTPRLTTVILFSLHPQPYL